MKGIFLFMIFLSTMGFTHGQKDNIGENQLAYYHCSWPLYLDSIQNFWKPHQVYFHFRKDIKPTDLKFSFGFESIIQKPENYFTAYLVNTTDTLFTAEMQDGSVMMIQEAMDENGNWKPIEYWINSGCGNSYNTLTLKAGKYVVIPIKKYHGDFKTKMRLKLKYHFDKEVLFSDSFEGSIHKNQFKKISRKVRGIQYIGPATYWE
jgi:hypothetical protein